jgi:hypothetical protein
MYKALLVTSAIALASISTNAFAASGAATGAAGGAVTGAIVGGPVGAAIGGVAGAVTGAALDRPPREVVTYVEQQPAPQRGAVVEEQVVVGQPVPSDVEIMQIPDQPRYAYAIVNHQRVIVEPRTHKVVEIVP